MDLEKDEVGMSRDIDRKIAEKVMGWTLAPKTRWSKSQKVLVYLDPPKFDGTEYLIGRDGYVHKHVMMSELCDMPEDADIFSPTTSISTAWEVVEKMKGLGYWLQIRVSWHEKEIVSAEFGRPSEEYKEYANTAPMAICLAALRATKEVT